MAMSLGDSGGADMAGGSGGVAAGWQEAQAYLRRFNTVASLERALGQLSGSYFLNPSDEMLLRLCYGMKEILKGATIQEKDAESTLAAAVERVRLLGGGRRSDEENLADSERLVRIASEAFTSVCEHIQELRHSRNVQQTQRVYLAQPAPPQPTDMSDFKPNNGQQPQWFEDGADGTSGVIQALQNDLRMIMQQQGASKEEGALDGSTGKGKRNKGAGKKRESAKPTLRRPFDAFWAASSAAFSQQYPILDYNQRRSLGWEEWRKMDEESKKKWKVMADEYNRTRLERGPEDPTPKRKREPIILGVGGDTVKRERKDDYRCRAMHYFVRERMAEISLLAPTANWATKMSRIRKEWKMLTDRSKWQMMADEFKRTGIEPSDPTLI